MTSPIRRIVWSLALVVAAHPLFIVVTLLVDRGSFSWPSALAIASIVTSVVFATGWTLIWTSAVRWTATVRFWTFLALLIGIAGGTGVGFAFDGLVNYGDLGWIFGTWIGGAIWIAATAFVWGRAALGLESTAEGAQVVVRCPKCGYDLRGARELRCSECGAELQLTELVARTLLDVVATSQFR